MRFGHHRLKFAQLNGDSFFVYRVIICLDGHVMVGSALFGEKTHRNFIGRENPNFGAGFHGHIGDR